MRATVFKGEADEIKLFEQQQQERQLKGRKKACCARWRAVNVFFVRLRSPSLLQKGWYFLVVSLDISNIPICVENWSSLRFFLPKFLIRHLFIFWILFWKFRNRERGGFDERGGEKIEDRKPNFEVRKWQFRLFIFESSHSVGENSIILGWGDEKECRKQNQTRMLKAVYDLPFFHFLFRALSFEGWLSNRGPVWGWELFN